VNKRRPNGRRFLLGWRWGGVGVAAWALLEWPKALFYRLMGNMGNTILQNEKLLYISKC
jgi:hypothetical protein